MFEPRRALEIVWPFYGSAYRIGGLLLLTAAHLVRNESGDRCRVRSRSTRGDVETEYDAFVAWKNANADIAVIKLPGEIEALEPVKFGYLPESGAWRIRFDMYGWPEWAHTVHTGGIHKAGGRHIPGEIFGSDRSSEHLLVLEPDRRNPADASS